MALTFRDAELLNQSFGNLDETLMRNRLMKQEQQRQQQEQQRLTQNEQNLNQYRQASLSNKEDEQKILNELSAARLAESQHKDVTAAQNTDTKASKVWYYISPKTRNVQTFAGTPEQAQKHLQDIQSHTGNEQIQMTDKEPDSLKDLNEIPIDDNNTLYASDADAVKYYSQKAAAQAKTAPKTTTVVKTGTEGGFPINETNTTTTATAPQPALSGPATAKPAMRGYKVGSTYQGMRYLGGDPNDQSNWQQ